MTPKTLLVLALLASGCSSGNGARSEGTGDGGGGGSEAGPSTDAGGAHDAPTENSDAATPDAGSVPEAGGDASTVSPLPEHLITGYWQDFDNGAQTLTLAQVPSSYDLVAVAFANADPSNAGGVTFSIDSDLASALGGYTEAQFQADVAALHGHGRKVVVSVGGQNGTISVTDATSATNLADSVYGLMQTWGFDGVDIDLENGITPSAMASAIQQLAAKAGPGLIVTLAPQTIDMQSTQGDYFQLALAIKDILTIVNMQYYNSGSMNGADGNVYSEGAVDFLTALAAIQLENGLRPDQVGLGLPASSSAAGSGYVDPSVVNAALDCLAEGTSCGKFVPSAKYPTVRGAMTWSVNWDASNGYAFGTAVSGGLASLP
jgi:chitinase